MNWINKIAFHKSIRNEVPNKELAKELAEGNNKEGIEEISNFLFDKNKSIASDCISVMYTIGYSKPELIVEYTDVFLKLLESKNNRMVWGSMIALSTVAQLNAENIYKSIELILETMKKGTVITEVWGIKTLVSLSFQNKKYKEKLMPILFGYLEECRPIDFATRVETILPIIETSPENELFNNILKMKSAELSDSQSKKLAKILRNRN